MSTKNGINMLDVKLRNRSSILELIYKNGAMPRKEIASTLGLTAAAITLITTDLIDEGLLYESSVRQAARRGRREILLKIKNSSYISIGVNITRHHFEIISVDLSRKILFQERCRIPVDEFGTEGVLSLITRSIKNNIINNPDVAKKTIIGVGVSIVGIVDTPGGLSVNSYGVLPENYNLEEYFRNELDLPCIVVNNICACANGELFQSGFKAKENILFIKHGPGIGAASVNSLNYFDLYDYRAVEIGHTIMESHGRPCVCGNRGCLETIISYDSIAQSVMDLTFKKDTKSLHDRIYSEYQNSEIATIMDLYKQGMSEIVSELDRVVYYMALSIKNTATVLEPEAVILYGSIFESETFKTKLFDELKKFHIDDKVHLSMYNKKLESIGSATSMISSFLAAGGKLE